MIHIIRTTLRFTAALAAALVVAVVGRGGTAWATTGTGNALYVAMPSGWHWYGDTYRSQAWAIPSGATHIHVKFVDYTGGCLRGNVSALVNSRWTSVVSMPWNYSNDVWVRIPAGATQLQTELVYGCYARWWSNTGSIDVPEYVSQPQPVTSFYVSATTNTSITLAWKNNPDNAIGNDGYFYYELYADNGASPIYFGMSTSYTHNVTAGSVHTYKVRVTDPYRSKFSAYSSTLTAHPTPNAPGTPTASSATTTSINVSWSANGNPSGVGYGLCENYWLNRCWDAGTATSYNVTGLAVDRSYRFYAYARKSDGGSVSSSQAWLSTWPNPPSNLSVSAASASRIDASWSANGNASTTQYYASITRVSDGATVASSGWIKQTGYSFTGLATNTAYRVTVRTSNPAAVSATRYTLAAVPTMTGVTTNSSSQLTAAWGANGNPSGTTYEVLRDARIDRNGSVFGGVVVDTGTATTFANSGLGANTYHTYMVRAKNGDGVFSGYSAQLGAWTSANTPGKPSYTDTFSNGVEVGWATAGNSGSTMYVLERSLDQVSWREVWRGTASKTVDVGLGDSIQYNADGVPFAAGKPFYHRVFAVNGAGTATTRSAASSTTLNLLKDTVSVSINRSAWSGEGGGTRYRMLSGWDVPYGGVLKRLNVHFDYSLWTNKYFHERITLFGYTPAGAKVTLWDGSNMYGFPSSFPHENSCGGTTGRWAADLTLNPDVIPADITRVEVWGERSQSTISCDYAQDYTVTLKDALLAVGYPNATAVLLDNGAPETSKHDITVGVVADKATYAAPTALAGGAPDTLQLSNDGVNWSSRSFAIPVDWRLGAEYGEKTVWVKLCRGGYCLASPFRRTIRVTGTLSPPRLTLAINGGADWSPGRTVTLSATVAVDGSPASYGPWQIAYSNVSAQGPWSAPETLSGLVARREWDLCDGLAAADCARNPRTVYARLTDALGHEVVTAAGISWGNATSVGVTTAAGTAATVPLNGQSVPVRVVNSPRVPLTLSAPAGSRWRVSFDGGATFGQWSPVSATAAIILPRRDGPVAAAVEFRLPDGTTSDIRVLDLLLDTQAPTLQASWLGNASVTRNGQATLVLNAQDNISPRSALQVSLDGGVTWQAYATTRTVTFSGSGYKTLTVLVRDQAGNVASAILGIYN